MLQINDVLIDHLTFIFKFNMKCKNLNVLIYNFNWTNEIRNKKNSAIIMLIDVSMTPCHHFQIRVVLLNPVSSLYKELRAKV